MDNASVHEPTAMPASPRERRQAIEAAFRAHFGHKPSLWSRAPGRVDLMGSHTDYNDGYVMTMTINRDTWIAATPRRDGQVEIYSMNLPGGSRFRLDGIEPDEETPWTNYVRGVAWALQEAGHSLSGFNALVHSTIPFNSGLSSSAAIEMAAVELFCLRNQLKLDGVTKALVGQKAENHFVGVNSGILDQYSSALGQAGSSLLLDCRHLSSRAVAIAPELRVVIADTRAKRALTGTEYDERRAQCEQGVALLQQYDPGIRALRDVSPGFLAAHEQEFPKVVARRCRFIVEENQRVLDLAEPLAQGERAQLNSLFAASYEGARDLFEIGAPAMEAMIKALWSGPGIVAGRQAGAGFGGCMVALVEEEQVAPFLEHVQQVYFQTTGIAPRVYPVGAAAGSGPLTF